MDTISRSGEHLLALINDVLEMSKIEAGRTTLNENSFDLYGLLNWLYTMLQLKAESKGLQLIFDKASNLPQYIRTDESKLRQVLVNLLAFSGEKPREERMSAFRHDIFSVGMRDAPLGETPRPHPLMNPRPGFWHKQMRHFAGE